MAKKVKTETIDFMQHLLFPQDKWVFQLKQKELHVILNHQLRAHGYNNLEHMPDGYTYAPGEIPVLLVAHTDTVHHKDPEIILYDPDSTYMWSPQGLGADDRAGVWGILALLRAGFKPHILFAFDEETGCKGARKATDAFETPPDVRYIVELDRKGSKDCVFYSCANDKFSKYVESFGFKTAQGSCSDISTLCPKWEIAGVNLSTGYYEQHSKTEHLVVNELAATLRKVSGMLKNVPATTFIYETKKYVPATTYYTSKWYKDSEYEDAYSRWYDYNSRNKVTVLYPDRCKKCVSFLHCPSKKTSGAQNCNLFSVRPPKEKRESCRDKYRCPDKNLGICDTCKKWVDGYWSFNSWVDCEECSEFYFCEEAGMFERAPKRRQCDYFNLQIGERRSCSTCIYIKDCYDDKYIPKPTDLCPEWDEEAKENFEDLELDAAMFQANFTADGTLEMAVCAEDLHFASTTGNQGIWEERYFENISDIGAEVVRAVNEVLLDIVKRLENPIDLKKVKA